MTDPILPGRRLSDLDFPDDPIGSEIYGNKNNEPVRLKVGEAGGLTTLDDEGKIPVAQVPDFIVRPEHYGAKANGVDDDLAAIHQARDVMAARGGGFVDMRGKVYAISDTLKGKSGVVFLGIGSGQYPPSPYATDADFIATAKTRLVPTAGFPVENWMVDLNCTRGDKYALQAAGMRGIMIDGNATVKRLLRTRAMKNCQVKDVLVFRPATTSDAVGWLIDTGQGAVTGAAAQAGGVNTLTLALAQAQRDGWYDAATASIVGGTGAGQSKPVASYVGATRVATFATNWVTPPDATSIVDITGECLEGNGATQFNNFEDITVWLGPVGYATGIVFDGDGVHDPNQNRYSNIGVVHANGPGFRFYNGDTESFRMVRTYAFGIGYGAIFYGNDSANNNRYARDLFFHDVLFGGANAGGRTGTAQAGGANTITLDVGASAVDDHYKDKRVTLPTGTGAGQTKRCIAYNGTTKVATVDSNWTTPPDNTTGFDIPNGGGCLLMKGSYKASGGHLFLGYQAGTNGASMPVMEDNAYCTVISELEAEYGGTNGYIMSLASHGPFTPGSRERLKFRSRLANGQMADFIELRNLVQGAAGTEAARLDIYLRRNGAAPALKISIGDGIAINGGAELKKILQATAALDFPSIAANSTTVLTMTVAGAAINDLVTLGPPSTGLPAGIIMGQPYVSAADTVAVRVANVSGAAIDPVSLSFRAGIWGF